MQQSAALYSHRIAGFEDLSQVVLGARSEVVQVERGKLQGELIHASIGGLPIDLGIFNVGVKSRGVLNKDRTRISMLTGCANRATCSSYEVRPGDALVTPPGGEHERRYYGGASVLVISLSAADIESMFGTEEELAEQKVRRKNFFRGTADTLQRVVPCVRALVTRLSQR